MANKLSNDFYWEFTDQPHASRRLQILRKHPQVRKLMHCSGDSRTAVCGAAVTVLLIACTILTSAYLSRFGRFFFSIACASWFSSYIFIIIHEAAHGLVFGPSRPRLNKMFGILVNCALGLPVYSFFKKHHRLHHKYQGDDQIDVEYPTKFELDVFDGHPVTRFFWLLWNGILQHIRAVCWVLPDSLKKESNAEMMVNAIVVVVFDVILIQLGFRHCVLQLMFSFGIAMGFNLMGLWGMLTHTVFFPGEDTVSYYGDLNKYYCNFGYHMEHHDFPNIPWRLLPKVREIAPEFYSDHHYLDSFYPPVFAFLFDPRLGIKARIKRKVERPIIGVKTTIESIFLNVNKIMVRDTAG